MMKLNGYLVVALPDGFMTWKGKVERKIWCGEEGGGVHIEIWKEKKDKPNLKKFYALQSSVIHKICHVSIRGLRVIFLLSRTV